MPELPEVEIIVNDLRCELIGRKIQDVQTDWPKYFQLPSRKLHSERASSEESLRV